MFELQQEHFSLLSEILPIANLGFLWAIQIETGIFSIEFQQMAIIL
jgi:hypothetical protein